MVSQERTWFQDIFSEDLRKIKQIRLEPFDETENITKRFCSHPATPKVVTKKRTQFLEMSKMNYWLLAFALQGCAKSPENSEPKSWIADEVKEYLRNLKTCNDPYCDQYPGILLALSPLYKNEVSTAEHYLIDKLKFTEPALNDLVKRGEITEQNDLNDNTLYGLPHSSLADAYWEHGQQYLRREDLRDYVTFIRDYATSNVTNGLTAIMKSNYSVRSSIISDLWKSGEIASAIKSENSMATIASWHMGHCFVDAPDTAVSEVLARKIAVAGDFYAASYCFMRDLPCDYSRQLWKLLDKNKLAHTLCCSDNLHEVTFFIYSLLRGVGIKAARELCGHLRISRLAETMVTKSNLNNACELIYFLLCIDNDKGRALWNSLNKQQLACIIAMENVDKVCFAFGSLFAGDDDVGWECWDLFGRKILATRLSSIQDVQYLERCTSNFLQYDPGDLWMTFQGDYFSSMWGYPRSLFSYKEKGQALYWERAALEFFQILDWQELLNKSEQFQDEMNILICMATRCGTYPWAGSRLPPIQNP